MASIVGSGDVPRVLLLFLAYYKAERGIAAALEQLAKTETRYAESLNRVSADILRNGTAFEVALKKEQLFSSDVISVLGAGQTSGQLELVLADVAATMKKQNMMIKNVIKSVSYQLVIVLSIILISPYLLFNVAEATPIGSSLRGFAAHVEMLRKSLPGIEYVYPASVIGFVAYLLMAPQAKQFALNVMSAMPLVKSALVNYQTGLWCNYAGLMLRAGLTIVDAERLLRPTLIEPLQAAFSKVTSVVIEKGWSVALDSVEPGDVRAIIPPVARSFMRSGGQSGLLDIQLKESAEYLLETANNQFESLTKILGMVVMLIAAAGVLALAMQVYLTRL